MKAVVYKGYRYFFGDNWCAKCSECGGALLKFAFTAEEAEREAVEALAEHRCRARRRRAA